VVNRHKERPILTEIIPQTRISQIIKGKRRITADTALRLSSYFGNSAKFWLGLQDDYDIEKRTTWGIANKGYNVM